mmetsp:Transcript_40692/g.93508  ORF Transcript_40692/g.93508 Transcript_40692/m.93508 type:complete len:205 (+) Transcript_40692:873-1487(+)
MPPWSSLLMRTTVIHVFFWLLCQHSSWVHGWLLPQASGLRQPAVLLRLYPPPGSFDLPRDGVVARRQQWGQVLGSGWPLTPPAEAACPSVEVNSEVCLGCPLALDCFQPRPLCLLLPSAFLQSDQASVPSPIPRPCLKQRPFWQQPAQELALVHLAAICKNHLHSRRTSQMAVPCANAPQASHRKVGARVPWCCAPVLAPESVL